ncbi:hypothetical protein E3V36_07005 [Candidatus Marinimicrobia bacterium MT.SAG.2]|nr:hypothetical protein E3V36_07005 [Candidatus Marinimicrobia bacterium MT.SAG.2]
MEVNSRPAIFLSAKGVKKRVDTKPISSEELGINREYSPGIMDGVIRSLLGFDYLEVEANVLGKKEIIELEELQYLEKFKKLGKREFLREMNEIAFLDLCDKINKIKENIVTVSGLESKNLQENIDLQIKTIQNYEKFKLNFVDWFTSNHFDVPIIPKQNNSIKGAYDKMRIISHDDVVIPIERFHTLEMALPKYIQPKGTVSVQLKGTSHDSKLIELPKMQSAFLMYLMMERDKSSDLWLLNPEKHINKLQEIINILDLPIKYFKAIQHNLEGAFTWFNSADDSYRRTMASLINTNLKKNGNVKGTLLIRLPKKLVLKGGIYTLIKTIKNTKINILQN